MDRFTLGWALVGVAFFVTAVVRSRASKVPSLPDLGERLEPMTLLPARSVWKRKETDL